MKTNTLRRIVIDVDDSGVVDVTFFFSQNGVPYSLREFTRGSETRRRLEFMYDRIEYAVGEGLLQ